MEKQTGYHAFLMRRNSQLFNTFLFKTIRRQYSVIQAHLMKIKVILKTILWHKLYVSCDPLVSDAIREDTLAPIDNSLDRCSVLMWFYSLSALNVLISSVFFLLWNHLVFVFHETKFNEFQLFLFMKSLIYFGFVSTLHLILCTILYNYNC